MHVHILFLVILILCSFAGIRRRPMDGVSGSKLAVAWGMEGPYENMFEETRHEPRHMHIHW